jgi:DNA-binding transcriptional LysR family regulator
VAEERHFGRAAERLYITQPPLSLQIRSLGRELGVELFVRGRHVELTEAGRALLEKARYALQAADAAVRAAQEAGKAGGHLRVGLPAAGGMELAPAAVRSFREKFPDIDVELLVAHTGAHLEALEANAWTSPSSKVACQPVTARCSGPWTARVWFWPWRKITRWPG